MSWTPGGGLKLLFTKTYTFSIEISTGSQIKTPVIIKGHKGPVITTGEGGIFFCGLLCVGGGVDGLNLNLFSTPTPPGHKK